MKIEWLNDELTEAIVTVGWISRRYANVVKVPGDATISVYYGDGYCRYVPRWNFKETGRAVQWDVCEKLESKRKTEFLRREEERNAPREWRPFPDPPKVRVIKGGV